MAVRAMIIFGILAGKNLLYAFTRVLYFISDNSSMLSGLFLSHFLCICITMTVLRSSGMSQLI